VPKYGGSSVHRRLLSAEHSCELDQTGDTARVVVGAGHWPARVVVCADNNPFRSVWSKARDYVAIRSVLHPITLLGNSAACLRKFAGDVRGRAIEIFQVSDVSRRQFNRELTNVCFQSHRIDRAHGIRLRPREQRLRQPKPRDDE
jgi:hypothetical protein